MDRRTFLKGVFVAAVTPASCVKALYQPQERDITKRDSIMTIKWPTYYQECREAFRHIEEMQRQYGNHPKGDRNVQGKRV